MSRICTLALAALLPAAALAQVEIGSCAIRGTLHDPSNAVVQDGTITVRHASTGYTRVVRSDGEGRFAAEVLPVGEYEIEATAPGFGAARARLSVMVGQAQALALMLPLAKQAETVTVVAAGAQEPQSISEGANISARELEEVPVRGRNFTELIQLTPGVMQESDRSGLVLSGQRSINSNIALDGADYNDPLLGNQRGGNDAVFYFPQTAVREFQVIRTGAGAEVGRTGGGFANVVTRSGTNAWHGEGFIQNRNRALTSPDAFGRSLNNQQTQFGGAIGGPLRADRIFVFAAAEHNQLRVPFMVKFQPQAAAVVVPAELLALEGERHGTNDPTAVFARADAQLTPLHRLTLNFSASRMRGENFDYGSPQVDRAESANYTREGAGRAGALGLLSTLGSYGVNELRVQYAADYAAEQPNLAAPAIVIKGFGTLGGDSDRPRRFESRRWQALDQLSVVRGRHRVRTGFDANISLVGQQRESNLQGRYDFKSVADYAAGRFDRFRQTIAVTGLDAARFRGTQREFAAFAQDEIAVRRDLSLTAGLRWEGQFNPQPPYPNPLIPQTTRIPSDGSMWQPRLGLAWNPGGASRTVVRLSAGIYAARTPATLYQRVFTDNGYATLLLDSKIDSSILKAVSYPRALAAAPLSVVVGAPRAFGFDPGFRNPRSFQTAATLDQELGAVSLSAGYVHQATWKLQRRLDRNLYPPVYDDTGLPVFPQRRPNPALGQLEINESTAHSSYDALVAAVQWKRGPRLSARLQYTFSRNYDDDSNERNFSKEWTLNPFDLSLERAYSKQDVRHNCNVMGTYALPGEVKLSAVLIARSGLPFTPIVGTDMQNDANDDNDRAIINGRVAGRNSMRQPGFFDLDVRLARLFRIRDRLGLELVGDLFNATRASNRNFGNDAVSEYGKPGAPVATAGQPLYAPSTARFGGPRQLQLGVRVVW